MPVLYPHLKLKWAYNLIVFTFSFKLCTVIKKEHDIIMQKKPFCKKNFIHSFVILAFCVSVNNICKKKILPQLIYANI